MRRRAVTALTLALAVVTLSAQGFDLRLGQWEYAISGMKMDLSKLPPAARAAAEEAMKRSATSRACLTAQDLKDLNLGANDDEDCKVTAKKITGRMADITMTCSGDEPRTQTMHYEALSRESMRGTVKVSGGDGPSEMTITGKWIAAACTEQ